MPLKDTISINTTPEKLYEWFMHFVENYKAWHPDHIIAKWIIGINFEKGSILYAEVTCTRLAGHIESLL